MKRIILLLIFCIHSLIGSEDQKPALALQNRAENVLIQILKSLSFLFPYTNTQSLIVNEDEEERITQQASPYFSANEPAEPN